MSGSVCLTIIKLKCENFTPVWKTRQIKEKKLIQLTYILHKSVVYIIPGLQSDIPWFAVYVVWHILHWLYDYHNKSSQLQYIVQSCNIMRNNDGVSCEPSQMVYY